MLLFASSGIALDSSSVEFGEKHSVGETDDDKGDASGSGDAGGNS